MRKSVKKRTLILLVILISLVSAVYGACETPDDKCIGGEYHSSSNPIVPKWEFVKQYDIKTTADWACPHDTEKYMTDIMVNGIVGSNIEKVECGNLLNSFINISTKETIQITSNNYVEICDGDEILLNLQVIDTAGQNILQAECAKLIHATVSSSGTQDILSSFDGFVCDGENEVIYSMSVTADPSKKTIQSITCAQLSQYTVDKEGCIGYCCCGESDGGCVVGTTDDDVILPKIYGKGIFDETAGVLFCSSNKNDKIWIPDLDLDSLACDAAGFSYTGTKCCGDDEDDHYEDIEGTGACWHQEYVKNWNTASSDRVIADDGQFYSCVSDVAPIAEMAAACTVYGDSEGPYHYCNPQYDDEDTDNVWNTSSQNLSHYSEIPAGLTIPGEKSRDGCCLPEQCWNGTGCQENQFNTTEPTENDYRCVDGQWIYSKKKSALDRTGQGACPENSQCLYSVNGNTSITEPVAATAESVTEIPACINSGDYITDYLCEEGNWTTRTKRILNNLLNFAEGNPDMGEDYTIFCANYRETLNKYDYALYEDKTLENRFFEGNKCQFGSWDVPCVNNFCVLNWRHNDKEWVYVGTSFNSNTTSNDEWDYLVFGYDEDVCLEHREGTDDEFKDCDPLYNTLFYNPKMHAFIYGVDGYENKGKAISNFFSFIFKPINDIFKYISDIWVPKRRSWPYNGIGVSFLNMTNFFDRAYYADMGGRQVIGVTEPTIDGKEHMTVYYKGFDTNICNYIDRYGNKSIPNAWPNDDIVCNKTLDGEYIVVTTDKQRIEGAWQDLTAKLRVETG